MTGQAAWDFVIGLWVVFAIYFGIAAFRTTRTKSEEQWWRHATRRGVLVVGYLLVLSSVPALGKLDLRFVPAAPSVNSLGVALTLAGIGLALWARHTLGELWSSRVTLKEGHELIRSGPYAWIRHPIYSGMLLAGHGTALVRGEWRALAGIGLVFLAFLTKAKQEDTLLEREFGGAFVEHRKRTGLFVPRV